MSLKTLKLVFFSSLSLSLLLSNSSAFAQSDVDGVVVPTGPSTSTPTDSSRPSDSNTTPTRSRTGTSSVPVKTATRFSCQNYEGEYTVMYQPESQPSQFFAWATPRALGGGWDRIRRCNTIAERLESYRPDGLVEMRTSTANGYNILCVTSEAVPSCRIVLTVPPEKDPFEVRNSVFQNLITADNGQQTTGVNTYTRNGSGGSIEQILNTGRELLGTKKTNAVSEDSIKLKYFLDKKDGGNGKLLSNGVTIRKAQPKKKPQGLRLNTDGLR
ncbi:MAG: COP23 domain-containing protein [Cyanobacteria bacterium P01_A01_bin.84]